MAKSPDLISDFDALKALEADPLLERLNEMLGGFNMFEALNVVRQEIRHSNFLAWLLNPRETHGLGSYPLQKFLTLINEADEFQQGTTVFAERDWRNAEVFREWRWIDLLIVDANHQYGLVIENKIDTGEHSNQLVRYQQVIESEFPNTSFLFLYLTPDGDRPEDEESIYLPISYDVVNALIGSILDTKANKLSSDVFLFINHYQMMLRRHILQKSNIRALCHEIYSKHKRALDLIYEHRPDLQTLLAKALEEVFRSDEKFLLADSNKTYIRGEVVAWRSDYLLQSQWSATENVLWFEFANRPDSLRLKLVIGPGPQEVRQDIWDVLLSAGLPFKPNQQKFTEQWKTVYGQDFLRRDDYKVADLEELIEEIKLKWINFLENDFQRINAVIVNNFIRK